MMKQTVILNPTNTEKEMVLGLNLSTTLKDFRKQLANKGYTEVNTYKKEGKVVAEFITEKLTRLQMIDSGVIKGTREERKQYREMTKSPRVKKANFGYTW